MNHEAPLTTSLSAGLTQQELRTHPIAQLELWLQQAVNSGLRYPTAMVVATMGTDGELDQRTVLLKHCDNLGLVFFAEDGSKKIQDLRSNPHVSVHFPWHELDRQVRIKGRVEKLDTAESTRYFITPPDYQIYASDSAEHPFSCRQFLIEQFTMMRSKFYGGGDRTPGVWSGYRIVPGYFEFWQGGGPRLRDRFVYKLSSENGWGIERINN